MKLPLEQGPERYGASGKADRMLLLPLEDAKSLPGGALPGSTPRAGGSAGGKTGRDETGWHCGGTRGRRLVVEWKRGGEDAQEWGEGQRGSAP